VIDEPGPKSEAEAGAYELAMFPLGSTVFPSQVVPLHIFEDRYRTLISRLTAGDADATFGIVLIDRGHEVGGDDHRVSVATRVEILQAEEFADGRWGVVTAGLERIDIVDWLDDDPYPRAMVRRRPVADNGGASLDELEALLVETIELAAKASGVEVPGPFDFNTDPQQRLDQLSALAPITAFDRQAVLEALTTADQIAILHDALREKAMLLRSELR
jgi:Lon protease-like protein